MYLMYVDESGDCGLVRSPSRYFVLSGLVVHESNWQSSLNDLVTFRRSLRTRFGLKLREEIHASAMVHTPGPLSRIRLNDRLLILRLFGDQLAKMTAIRFVNVVIDKQGKSADFDVFEIAWKVLIQRLENTIENTNFPGSRNPQERGALFPDQTDNEKLRKLLRKMRHFNYVPNQAPFGSGSRNLVIDKVIEDPHFKDSQHSYFVQAADLTAFFLYQSLAPNKQMRKHGGANYFKRLEPVLCKVASSKDPLGIVRI